MTKLHCVGVGVGVDVDVLMLMSNLLWPRVCVRIHTVTRRGRGRRPRIARSRSRRRAWRWQMRHVCMRENSRFEMMRAAGAKAVVSVEMAVPPTMVAGELSVENSEGETSDEWRRFLRRRLFGLGLDD
jgi:hypothetical protein